MVGVGAAGAMLKAPLSAQAEMPESYPRSYARLINLAGRERRLVIYTAIEENEVGDVLKQFHVLYPWIAVDYEHIHSTTLYDRFTHEVAMGVPTADMVISSAMDTQIKLVNDGFAQTYSSPEKPNLPPWAIWKDQAYGLTAEPIVFAYNKASLAPHTAPQSHDDLTKFLGEHAVLLRSKVATYDPQSSATGFLFLTQDIQISHDTWRLARALGETRAHFLVSGNDILNSVASGQFTIAYNMISSYLLEKMRDHPQLGIVYPSDYTLVMSRIAFIAKDARHPACAKLFLDYLLSKSGQALFAKRHMTPARNDVAPISKPPSAEILRAIHVGPSLLANIDQYRRGQILRRWQEVIA